jgi:hypothetical protein
MAIQLLALETAELRSNRILESGSSHARWESASAATASIRADAERTFRENIAMLCIALDPDRQGVWPLTSRAFPAEPDATFDRERQLACAVIDADGYCW